jgi:hypothetical protein
MNLCTLHWIDDGDVRDLRSTRLHIGECYKVFVNELSTGWGSTPTYARVTSECDMSTANSRQTHNQQRLGFALADSDVQFGRQFCVSKQLLAACLRFQRFARINKFDTGKKCKMSCSHQNELSLQPVSPPMQLVCH